MRINHSPVSPARHPPCRLGPSADPCRPSVLGWQNLQSHERRTIHKPPSRPRNPREEGVFIKEKKNKKLVTMAKKAKTRVIIVRLISMAATGFFYTFTRPRTSLPMSMLKYDPIVRRKVLFLEQKRKGSA
ncbi:hypothetical protein B0H67DRAFT_590102 [Lasiosphaeris hirsuta]|uniref:Large ribosomal subunit protein bL33m n=1 Tax=Lasiosphaeris hirsuta TaxID=260670 RepID=A0AA40DLQ2_9PEZI|nr:hypothetical protein B0H67DRAFT_590102 [Lasiosphaeris hirsuta]